MDSSGSSSSGSPSSFGRGLTAKLTHASTIACTASGLSFGNAARINCTTAAAGSSAVITDSSSSATASIWSPDIASSVNDRTTSARVNARPSIVSSSASSASSSSSVTNGPSPPPGGGASTVGVASITARGSITATAAGTNVVPLDSAIVSVGSGTGDSFKARRDSSHVRSPVLNSDCTRFDVTTSFSTSADSTSVSYAIHTSPNSGASQWLSSSSIDASIGSIVCCTSRIRASTYCAPDSPASDVADAIPIIRGSTPNAAQMSSRETRRKSGNSRSDSVNPSGLMSLTDPKNAGVPRLPRSTTRARYRSCIAVASSCVASSESITANVGVPSFVTTCRTYCVASLSAVIDAIAVAPRGNPNTSG